MNLALLAAAALPFVVSPGASFTLTISATTTGDRWAPAKVWTGTSLGIVLIAGVAALSGLGQLIAGNDVARAIFGITGGIVLIALGLASFVTTLRPAKNVEEPRRMGPRLVLWAFVTVITNVKALGIYALVVPALRGAGAEGPPLFLAFAGVHVVMLLAWLALVGTAVRLVPVLGTSQRARTVLLLLAASTLVLLGARTLVDAVS